MSNKNLKAAYHNKRDEFYTRYKDIEAELKHYEKQFVNKTIYCNCDFHWTSQFVNYFIVNFDRLKLKKLIATGYTTTLGHYYDYSHKGVTVRKLNENGDFRSEESIALLHEADIVVLNPPFSLFREYIAQLEEHNKRYLFVGSLNAVAYPKTFELFKKERAWLGVTSPKAFTVPDEYRPFYATDKTGSVRFGNIEWFTNLHHKKREDLIPMRCKYSLFDYPKYDNYSVQGAGAIEVSRVIDIPYNYRGRMGVPITFLKKHNPHQFQLLDLQKTLRVRGRMKYARIIIRHV